jgi:allantoinase
MNAQPLQDRNWGFDKMAAMLSEQPARVVGLQQRKGTIRVGLDADLVIWHPYSTTNTTEAHCRHRHKATPYQDMALLGRVHSTFVQGAMVYGEAEGVYTDRVCGSALLTPSNGK